MVQLLNEVRQGGMELKPMATKDKSKPAISNNMSLKKWNKEGFLAKVHQGTPLCHI